MKLKKIFVLMLAAIAITAGCSAKSRSEQRTFHPVVAADTIMYNAIGDSIYHIIANAKKIELTALPLQTDSTEQTTTKRVSSQNLELLKFIATNPKNYLSDITAYGIFTPQVQATYMLKNAMIVFKYDFGLRKWGIFDAEDRQIALFDLASDDMLRFACKTFPDNKFINELLLTRIQ